MKTAGFRIRVEPELRQAFVNACQARDQSAAQVLRAFMRKYVEESVSARQRELFAVAEREASYSISKQIEP